MSNHKKKSFFNNVIAAVIGGILFPILVAFIIQDARFAPNSEQEVSSQENDIENSDTFPIKEPTASSSSELKEPLDAVSPLTISGEWEGRYTCSKGVTGVTIAMSQDGNEVIAEFSLYPVAENPEVPRGVAQYKGNFNPVSRLIVFPTGVWLEKPGSLWTAFGFQGRFDESLKTFSGEMDHHSCTNINLSKLGG